MAKKSRDKGKAGEREFLNLLGDELGMRFSRNLNQADEGGADNTQLSGWVIEIKRYAKPSIATWWRQACSQVELGQWPVLAYRIDRQSWRVMVPMGAVHVGFTDSPYLDVEMGVTLSIKGFAAVVREHLSSQELAA